MSFRQCRKNGHTNWRSGVRELVRTGNDFPTVWSTLIRRHALVDGVPQSKMEGGRAVLEIRLVTGERLVFDGDDAKRFSVS